MHLARIGLVPYILSAAPSARDAANGAHVSRRQAQGLLKKDGATHLNGQLRRNGSRLD